MRKILRQGNRGADVKALKQYLRSLGFDLNNMNSIFDYELKVEVSVFQKICKSLWFEDDKSILIDGVSGPQTKKLIQKYNPNNFLPEVYDDVTIIPNITSYQIDTLIHDFKNPKANRRLYGTGKIWLDMGKLHKINPLVMLCKCIQESAFGNSRWALKHNNLFGYAVTDSGPTGEAYFKSLKQNIEFVTSKVRSLFLDPDNWRYCGKTLFGIELYYATAAHNPILKAYYWKILKEMLKKY
ncbi:unnamed protein product [marine sediment metagenome]|uniref:Mannosyl-glycoprotein endo-beta-N-acetylglucosamidase-like domain-containing protein n=1 Tax=marine sediment metagenome TaxID=412755 RepID=X1AZI6_9ZZZZ